MLGFIIMSRYRVANVKQNFEFKPEFDDGKEAFCLGGKKAFKGLGVCIR